MVWRIATVTLILFQLGSSDVLNCVCGREGARTRIVNGRPVAQGKFPWMVALVNIKNGMAYQFCGGTFINDRWVLTAAHCVPDMKPNEVFVARGQVDLQNLNIDNILAVDKIWLHPSYVGKSNNHRNDIALLRLSKPVSFTTDLLPICLPKADMLFFDNLFNIGWGKTIVKGQNSLKLLYIDTKQRNDCETIYKHLDFWSKQVCTHSTGNGICQGDSGGPLSTRKQGYVTQVGINSWVISDTCGEYPDVTTRVSSYLNEINQVTTGSNWCRNPNLGQ